MSGKEKTVVVICFALASYYIHVHHHRAYVYVLYASLPSERKREKLYKKTVSSFVQHASYTGGNFHLDLEVHWFIRPVLYLLNFFFQLPQYRNTLHCCEKWEVKLWDKCSSVAWPVAEVIIIRMPEEKSIDP